MARGWLPVRIRRKLLFWKRDFGAASKKQEELAQLIGHQQAQFYVTVLLLQKVKQGLLSEAEYARHKREVLAGIQAGRLSSALAGADLDGEGGARTSVSASLNGGFQDGEWPSLTKAKLRYLQDLFEAGCITADEYRITESVLLRRLALQGAEVDVRDVAMVAGHSHTRTAGPPPSRPVSGARGPSNRAAAKPGFLRRSAMKFRGNGASRSSFLRTSGVSISSSMGGPYPMGLRASSGGTGSLWSGPKGTLLGDFDQVAASAQQAAGASQASSYQSEGNSAGQPGPFLVSASSGEDGYHGGSSAGHFRTSTDNDVTMTRKPSFSQDMPVGTVGPAPSTAAPVAPTEAPGKAAEMAAVATAAAGAPQPVVAQAALGTPMGTPGGKGTGIIAGGWRQGWSVRAKRQAKQTEWEEEIAVAAATTAASPKPEGDNAYKVPGISIVNTTQKTAVQPGPKSPGNFMRRLVAAGSPWKSPLAQFGAKKRLDNVAAEAAPAAAAEGAPDEGGVALQEKPGDPALGVAKGAQREEDLLRPPRRLSFTNPNSTESTQSVIEERADGDDEDEVVSAPVQQGDSVSGMNPCEDDVEPETPRDAAAHSNAIQAVGPHIAKVPVQRQHGHRELQDQALTAAPTPGDWSGTNAYRKTRPYRERLDVGVVEEGDEEAERTSTEVGHAGPAGQGGPAGNVGGIGAQDQYARSTRYAGLSTTDASSASRGTESTSGTMEGGGDSGGPDSSMPSLQRRSNSVSTISGALEMQESFPHQLHGAGLGQGLVKAGSEHVGRASRLSKKSSDALQRRLTDWQQNKGNLSIVEPFVSQRALTRNIKLALRKLVDEICDDDPNRCLQPSGILSSQEIETIAERKPASKAELLKVFSRHWVDNYGQQVLTLVRAEVNKHVNVLASHSASIAASKGVPLQARDLNVSGKSRPEALKQGKPGAAPGAGPEMPAEVDASVSAAPAMFDSLDSYGGQDRQSRQQDRAGVHNPRTTGPSQMPQPVAAKSTRPVAPRAVPSAAGGRAGPAAPSVEEAPAVGGLFEAPSKNALNGHMRSKSTVPEAIPGIEEYTLQAQAGEANAPLAGPKQSLKVPGDVRKQAQRPVENGGASAGVAATRQSALQQQQQQVQEQPQVKRISSPYARPSPAFAAAAARARAQAAASRGADTAKEGQQGVARDQAMAKKDTANSPTRQAQGPRNQVMQPQQQHLLQQPQQPQQPRQQQRQQRQLPYRVSNTGFTDPSQDGPHDRAEQLSTAKFAPKQIETPTAAMKPGAPGASRVALTGSSRPSQGSSAFGSSASRGLSMAAGSSAGGSTLSRGLPSPASADIAQQKQQQQQQQQQQRPQLQQQQQRPQLQQLQQQQQHPRPQQQLQQQQQQQQQQRLQQLQQQQPQQQQQPKMPQRPGNMGPSAVPRMGSSAGLGSEFIARKPQAARPVNTNFGTPNQQQEPQRPSTASGMEGMGGDANLAGQRPDAGGSAPRPTTAGGPIASPAPAAAVSPAGVVPAPAPAAWAHRNTGGYGSAPLRKGAGLRAIGTYHTPKPMHASGPPAAETTPAPAASRGPGQLVRQGAVPDGGSGVGPTLKHQGYAGSYGLVTPMPSVPGAGTGRPGLASAQDSSRYPGPGRAMSGMSRGGGVSTTGAPNPPPTPDGDTVLLDASGATPLRPVPPSQLTAKTQGMRGAQGPVARGPAAHPGQHGTTAMAGGGAVNVSGPGGRPWRGSGPGSRLGTGGMY